MNNQDNKLKSNFFKRVFVCPKSHPSIAFHLNREGEAQRKYVLNKSEAYKKLISVRR